MHIHNILCLKILKYLLYTCITPLFVFYMGIVAMPFVYMYIYFYRGPQGRKAYVLIVTPSQSNVKINLKYDKRDDFNFEKVDFPFLDRDVPRFPSYGRYISQLIRFARVCSNVEDFNNRNKFLTSKLLKQGYRYHKLRKAVF